MIHPQQLVPGCTNAQPVERVIEETAISVATSLLVSLFFFCSLVRRLLEFSEMFARCAVFFQWPVLVFSRLP